MMILKPPLIQLEVCLLCWVYTVVVAGWYEEEHSGVCCSRSGADGEEICDGELAVFYGIRTPGVPQAEIATGSAEDRQP